jgi:hypothetical protein
MISVNQAAGYQGIRESVNVSDILPINRDSDKLMVKSLYLRLLQFSVFSVFSAVKFPG